MTMTDDQKEERARRASRGKAQSARENMSACCMPCCMRRAPAWQRKVVVGGQQRCEGRKLARSSGDTCPGRSLQQQQQHRAGDGQQKAKKSWRRTAEGRRHSIKQTSSSEEEDEMSTAHKPGWTVYI